MIDPRVYDPHPSLQGTHDMARQDRDLSLLPRPREKHCWYGCWTCPTPTRHELCYTRPKAQRSNVRSLMHRHASGLSKCTRLREPGTANNQPTELIRGVDSGAAGA